MAVLAKGQTQAQWTRLPGGDLPPLGIYVEFSDTADHPVYWGVTTLLKYHVPGGTHTETVFVALDSTAGELIVYPRIYAPHRVSRWREASEARQF